MSGVPGSDSRWTTPDTGVRRSIGGREYPRPEHGVPVAPMIGFREDPGEGRAVPSTPGSDPGPNHTSGSRPRRLDRMKVAPAPDLLKVEGRGTGARGKTGRTRAG